MKITLICFAVLAGILALDWVFEGQNFFMYRFFAPRYESVRRTTYEQTKSYRQGSIQRLNTLCSQRAEADQDHKRMLDDVIAQEFAEWNTADVPAYLAPCLTSARSK